MMIMRVALSMAMFLIPAAAGASADCRIINLPDHDEVVCTGDAAPSPVPSAPDARAAGTEDRAIVTAQTYTGDDRSDATQGMAVVATGRSFGAFRPRTIQGQR